MLRGKFILFKNYFGNFKGEREKRNFLRLGILLKKLSKKLIVLLTLNKMGTGNIYKTSNKGKTRANKFNAGGECSALSFVNPENGFSVVENNLYRTKNGGENWEKHKIIDRPLATLSAKFINPMEGYLTGYFINPNDAALKSGEGVVLHTVDAGLPHY